MSETSIPSRLIERIRQAVDRAAGKTADYVGRSLNPDDTAPEERVTGRFEAYLEEEVNSIGVVAGYSVSMHCDDFRWNYEGAPEGKSGADIICIMTVRDIDGTVVLNKFVLLQAKMDGGGTRPEVTGDGRWSPRLAVGKTALRDMHKSSSKLLGITDASYFAVYDSLAVPVTLAQGVEALRESLERAPSGEHTKWVLTADSMSTVIGGMPQCTHGDPDPRNLKLALETLSPGRFEDMPATHVWRLALQKEEERSVPVAVRELEEVIPRALTPRDELSRLEQRSLRSPARREAGRGH